MIYKVVVNPRATISIIKIGSYLSSLGYPFTANKFTEELFDFISNLGLYPLKYSTCRNKTLASRGYHCAPYKDWVFIYRVERSKVVLIDVVHGSRLK